MMKMLYCSVNNYIVLQNSAVNAVFVEVSSNVGGVGRVIHSTPSNIDTLWNNLLERPPALVPSEPLGKQSQ